jgi:hypothetical protein
VGLVPAIHVFLCFAVARRGWPASADHDDGTTASVTRGKIQVA